MISDLIVWGSVAFSAAFLIAWLWSPQWRAWIERPKHQFLDAVRGYDRAGGSERTGKEPKRP
jgi:hypothetical protein